jgi:hypothetical protein
LTSGCSKALGSIFGLFFILASILGLIFFQLEYKLLQPEPYIDALQRGGLPNRLTEILAQELAVNLEADPCLLTPGMCERIGGPPGYFSQLSEKEWQQLLDLVITPEWLAEQAETVIRGIFQVIESGEANVFVSVNVQPIKARLSGDAGIQIIDLMLASQPVCTPDQVSRIGQLLITGGSVEKLLECAPPPEIRNLAMPILTQQLEVAAEELPNQINLDLGGIADLGIAGGRDGGNLRRFLQNGILWSAVLAAGSLLLALLFSVRSTRDFFTTLGWPVLMVGLIALLGSLGLRSSSGLVFGYLIGTTDALSIQPETLDFANEFIKAVIGTILGDLIILSIGLILVGGLLLMVSRLFAGKPSNENIRHRPENLF